MLLHERFQGPLDGRLIWRNPPSRWQVDSGTLVVYPDAATDFWQRTHYGFQFDNGHLLALPVDGDFVLETHVRFHPVHQYDQAGLMLHAGESCWIKASVEHEVDGPAQLGTVLTNLGYSDWSLQDFRFAENEVRLRITKTGGDVVVEFGSAADTKWKPMRVGHLDFPANECVLAGIYACSPKGAGFRAEFLELKVQALPS